MLQTGSENDKISVEYQCDFNQFRRIFTKLLLPSYLTIFGLVFVLLGFVAVFAVVCIDGLIVKIVYSALFCGALCLVAAIMIKSLRRQIANLFAMHGKDGLVGERLEIEGNNLVIKGLFAEMSAVFDRQSIIKVKRHKEYFSFKLALGSVKAIPLNEQTEQLYIALTDDAVWQRAALANPTKDRDVAVRPTDVMSFEYELSRKQCIEFMTDMALARVAFLILSCVFFVLLAAVMYVRTFVYGDGKLGLPFVLALAMTVFVLLFIVYSLYVVIKSRKNGAGYFEMSNVDGKCYERIELGQLGIVSVNVLKNTRSEFRIASMARVRRRKKYFVIEFKSGEILPVPFNAETSRLYDVLVSSVPKPLSGRLK